MTTGAIMPAELSDIIGTDDPIFAAPWEAQAFAMTIALHERSTFTWPEWAEALAAVIAEATAAGDPDRGDTYYEHWMTALERLCVARSLAQPAALAAREAAWARAASATPHGSPILLENDPQLGGE